MPASAARPSTSMGVACAVAGPAAASSMPPARRPEKLYADRGYDHDKYRAQVRSKGITPVIARRGAGHGSGLGMHRWVVEQAIALLHWFRRLRIRCGHRATTSTKPSSAWSHRGRAMPAIWAG